MVDGRLTTIPRREKDREAMRLYFAAKFDENTSYTEEEVNSILLEFYSDYAYLRRELIDHGLMKRTAAGDFYHLSRG
jgi:hypothetical protein